MHESYGITSLSVLVACHVCWGASPIRLAWFCPCLQLISWCHAILNHVMPSYGVKPSHSPSPPHVTSSPPGPFGLCFPALCQIFDPFRISCFLQPWLCLHAKNAFCDQRMTSDRRCAAVPMYTFHPRVQAGHTSLCRYMSPCVERIYVVKII